VAVEEERWRQGQGKQETALFSQVTQAGSSCSLQLLAAVKPLQLCSCFQLICLGPVNSNFRNIMQIYGSSCHIRCSLHTLGHFLGAGSNYGETYSRKFWAILETISASQYLARSEEYYLEAEMRFTILIS